MEGIRRLNPITHENQMPVATWLNCLTAVSLVGGAYFHYLGNRYLWRWYGDRQLLCTHAIQGGSLLACRLVSNLIPGQVVQQDEEGAPTARASSSISSWFRKAAIFAPMFLLPYLGEPKLSFWGCLLGFGWHRAIAALPWNMAMGCMTIGVAAGVVIRQAMRARPQASPDREVGAPPPATTLKEEEEMRLCAAQFTAQFLQQLPPAYELKSDAQFSLQQFSTWFSAAFPTERGKAERMREKIGEIERDLGGSNPAVQQFGLLLRNLGCAMEGLSEEDRKPHLQSMEIAFHKCGTQWVDGFTSIYEEVISGGKGMEWQVERHHHVIKWQIWQEHLIPILGSTEEVHWRISWVDVFGSDLGMEMPAGINGEEVMLENNVSDLGFFAGIFVRQLMSVAAAGRKRRLEAHRDRWLHLFEERYTPALLVDYWVGVLNEKGGKVGNEKSLGQEIGAKIREIAAQEADPGSEDDPEIAMGYYTMDYKVTEKGVIRFLQEMGVFEAS